MFDYVDTYGSTTATITTNTAGCYRVVTRIYPSQGTTSASIARVTVYPSATTGTSTITYSNYYDNTPVKVAPSIPKNWRWFDRFRTYKPYSKEFISLYLKPVIPKFLTMVSLKQARLTKRKIRNQAMRKSILCSAM